MVLRMHCETSPHRNSPSDIMNKTLNGSSSYRSVCRDPILVKDGQLLTLDSNASDARLSKQKKQETRPSITITQREMKDDDITKKEI